MSEVTSAKISKSKLSKLMDKIQNDPNLAAKLDLLEEIPSQSTKSEFIYS